MNSIANPQVRYVLTFDRRQDALAQHNVGLVASRGTVCRAVA
jgi:hypothetical protein